MRLAVDIDGVIANIEPAISKRISEHFGVEISEVNKDKFFMHDRFNIEPQAMEAFMASDACLGGDGVWQEALGFESNIDALNDAYFEHHAIILVTGRHNTARTATNNWLAKHGVRHHMLLMQALQVKHRAMKFAGCELMIEDRFDEARTIANKGFRSYIIERDYNARHKLEPQPDNLFWVPDIRTVLEMESI